MTSEAKLAANRRNAQRSTGPRTAAGKARVRRNALQHGLAVPVSDDQQTAEQIERLAIELAAGSLVPAQQNLARRAAEAQVELLRVRRTKLDGVGQTAKHLANGNGGALPKGKRTDMAFAFTTEALAAYDRYEGRALSRRNRAARKLQVAQAARPKKVVEEVGPRVPQRTRAGRNPFDREVWGLVVADLMKFVARAEVSKPYHFSSQLPSGLQRLIATLSGSIDLDGDRALVNVSFDVDGERVAQTFQLVRLPSRVGGGSWLVRCPETRKMVRELYFAPGERLFRSRHALGLTYRSKRLSPSDAHFARCLRLLERIGASDARDIPEMPPRPKHMHRMTYIRLCDEAFREWVLMACTHLGWTFPWEDPNWPSRKRPRKDRAELEMAILVWRILEQLSCGRSLRDSDGTTRVVPVPDEAAHPFRDDAAHPFRDDLAHHSGMISPGVPPLADSDPLLRFSEGGTGCPAERTTMRQVRDVLRLKLVGGVATREIARRIGVAASTVRTTIRRFQAAGLSWPRGTERRRARGEVVPRRRQ
jgi:hypothetical protein